MAFNIHPVVSIIEFHKINVNSLLEFLNCEMDVHCMII